jgi:sugar lactone lactonase YvrE
VAAAEPILSGRIFVDQNGAETGVAIVNTSAQSASITLVLRDSSGNQTETRLLTLDPWNHVARFVSEWFPHLSEGFSGTLTLGSSQAVAAITLRLIKNAYNEDLYSTLPVVDLSRPAASDPVVFPHVAAGGGYSTTILLMNGSAQTERGTVHLIGSDGEPLRLRVGNTESAELPYIIPPNGACRFDLDAPANLVTGYAVVEPEPGSLSPAGSAIFRLEDDAGIVTEAGVPASVPTTSARIFVDNAGSYTGLALANRQNLPADVTLTLLTTDGVPISMSPLPIPPLGHVAKLVHEIFPEIDAEAFTGLIEIQGSQPFSATTLELACNSRQSPILTTLPVADLVHPPTAPLLVFPQIAIGNDFSTRLILINPGDRGVSAGSVGFFQSNGSPWSITIGRETASRFSYSLPPRGGRQHVPASDAPIASISVIDPSSNLPTSEIAVNEGNTLRPRLRVLDTTGAQRDDFRLSFLSIDPEVATVAADGTITGRKAGFSTLSISSGVEVVATATITVATVSIGIGGNTITGIVQDAARRLYLAATQDHTILLARDIGDVPEIYAGLKATPGLRNGLRLESLFRNPSFLALNQAQGGLYVSDGANNVVRRVQPGPGGTVETLAGTGTRGSKDGPAPEAEFNNPQGACLDGRGNLWVVDSGNHTIRRINLTTGVVETIAGKPGTPGSSDGTGGTARFNSPVGIASETDSIHPSFLTPTQPPAPVSMIVADTGNGRLRRVKETGEVETILSPGNAAAYLNPSTAPDNASAGVVFSSPTGVAVDPVGNIYVAETNARRVRLVLRNGDVVSATQADTLTAPAGLFVSQGGRIVISDGGHSAQFVYGAPQITSITPDRIDSKGGQTVTVQGSNFSPETTVALRGTLVSGLRIETTRTLEFTAPAVVGGLNTLTVQNRGGLAQKAILMTPPSLAELPRGYITTVAGGGNSAGDGGSATDARIRFPTGVAMDPAGNAFFAEEARVRRVDSRTGIITTVVGTGEPGDSGDGGLATVARLSRPYGVAVDAAGNLFVSDGHKIRRLDAKTGIIDTIAGTGAWGFSGDNGPAREAQLNSPAGIAFDSFGNLIIADSGNHRIRKIDARTQIITTIAGIAISNYPDSGPLGDNGPATAARLERPVYVAVDSADNIYVSSFERVRRIDGNSQIITTVAGGGTIQTYLNGGQRLPATSIRLVPVAVAVGTRGDLFISNDYGGTICRVDAGSGLIERFAGLGIRSEENVPALEAFVGQVQGIIFDGAGNLLFTDTDSRFVGGKLRKVEERTQTVSTVAGTGKLGHWGDNGPAIAAEIFTGSLQGSNYAKLAFDGRNNLYISDPWNSCIRRIDASSGSITTVYSGDAHGIALDPEGNLLVAAAAGVWRLDPAGTLVRIAGRTTPNPDPRLCQQWDGRSALEADLGSDLPALALDRNGDLLISDRLHHRIRKVQLRSGVLTTIAGSDSCISGGFSGDGGPATKARLDSPWGVAVDGSGNVLIADWQNRRIRKVDAITGVIDTVVDISSGMVWAKNFTVDDSGNIYLLNSDGWGENIIKVESATGRHVDITRPRFQEGPPGLLNDGISAAEARLIDPTDIIIDPQGNLWIADSGSGRVRVIRGPL